MDDNFFAQRLKELRAAANLTQTQLSEKANVSQQMIAHLENGKREPGWQIVLKLAAALDVDCRAFTEEPADTDTTPSPRGRPAKAAEEPPAEKKSSGRRGKK